MKKQTSKAVIGCGFGDEGKGLTTSYLVSKTDNPIVVRFNGGHQAGHTVIYKGKRHVFSSFGSGTLQDAPTYWSKFCTFYPKTFMRESEELENFLFFIDPLAPVTTPFDVVANRNAELIRRHGTVGMGFGTTIERHENHCKFYVQDLFYDEIMMMKLRMIREYYSDNVDLEKDEEVKFINSCMKLRDKIHMSYDDILEHFTPIYEGAQGIMLDKDFGFFPHVTRSNTTTKNIFEIGSVGALDEIYYVTRSYMTRHGNGPLPGWDLAMTMSEEETNKDNKYQGKFRTAQLDATILDYAIQCDDNFSADIPKNLVITCMDHFPINVNDLISKINMDFEHIYVSDGPSLSHIKLYK